MSNYEFGVEEVPELTTGAIKIGGKMNELKPVSRTARGLVMALFDEINGLRAGTTTIQRAQTVHKLATQIIESAKLEVFFAGPLRTSAREIAAPLD